MRDLTKDQLLLLNTDFGEEVEKQASAIVYEETEKIAELEEVAASCMAYGSELAMQKIAEMEHAHQEKVAMEEEKKEDIKGLEKKEDEEEDEEEEEEKNASAMGNFILEGYWSTLMEKGAEYYGDKDIYIEELCKEAKLGKVEKFIKSMKSKAGKSYGAAKKSATKGYEASKKHVIKNKAAYSAGGAGSAGLGIGYLAGKNRD